MKTEPPPGYEWLYPTQRRPCRAHEMVYRSFDREHPLHISEAWFEYEKIAAPARIALLRELADELRAGTSDLSDAIGDSGSFFGPKRRPEDILDARADALEDQR